MPSKLSFVFAGLLIFWFLYRVVVPAHEYPIRPEQVLTMLFEVGLLIGLFGAKSKLPAWLFWAALVCGVGLFLIRFTSDAAWWTGHLRYELLPR
jgi:hypothetical protein